MRSSGTLSLYTFHHSVEICLAKHSPSRRPPRQQTTGPGRAGATFRVIRFLLPLLVLTGLVACDARVIAYDGTCAEHTQQFMDYVHSLVVDEFTPVIQEGFNSGPTAYVMKRIEELNTRVSEINTPACYPRTNTAKDALLVYAADTRTYFTVVAGRALYGEGSVQAQWTKMYEAGFAFEDAFADLQK